MTLKNLALKHAVLRSLEAGTSFALQSSVSNVPNHIISQKIYYIRGNRVMLDSDLAKLYEVSAKKLNQQVKRNLERFPDDFMFALTSDEFESLRFQIGILNARRGKHRKYLPYAFTEQGVAMLSSVLNSKRAVAVNIEIMRAFVRIRELMAGNKELAQKLAELETKVDTHDTEIKVVFDAIRELISPPLPSKRRKVGFKW